jgi:hypothetical protein
MDRRSTKSLWRDYGVPMQDPNAFSLQYYKDTSKDPSKPAPKTSPKKKKIDYTDHTGLLKIQKPKKAQSGLKTNKPDYTGMGAGFINRNSPTIQNDIANDPSLVRQASPGEIPEYIGGNAPAPGVSKYIGGYGSGKTMEWLVNTTVKNPEWLAWEAAKKAKPGYIPRQIKTTVSDIINMGKGIKNLEQPDIGSGLLPGLVISLMKRRFADKPIYDLNNVGKKQIGGKLPEQAPDRVRRSWERDPELLYPDKFNTKLTPEEEARYQQWLKGPGKNSVWDQSAYDVRGSWKSQGEKIAPGHGHDTWKKPNHPTFSTESIYATQRQYPAATWEEDGGYSPSEFSKGLYSKEYYKRLFARERENNPRAVEHLEKYKIGGKMIGLLKKGGKVGDPKNRNKPGGSNVGKYSKSEGPFAGPSGGAPAGSYPIGSKSRGKSALKLAHNAPNPAGIKAAVYRKYPDLKKKALHGAKLGLLGMGQMQGKAPQPTDRNAPADKVNGPFKMTKKKRKEPRPAFAH